MSESELLSEAAITDTRDNDTSVAKARLAEYRVPGRSEILMALVRNQPLDDFP